ncbi:hypothetical protein HAX54_044565, partial [Datura stramonium]|nr:hypothetical protein [Datura stramonium]
MASSEKMRGRAEKDLEASLRLEMGEMRKRGDWAVTGGFLIRWRWFGQKFEEKWEKGDLVGVGGDPA